MEQALPKRVSHKLFVLAKKHTGPRLDDEHFEEIKIELVSHELSQSVKNARTAKAWTQSQLAKACSVKADLIHALENGTA